MISQETTINKMDLDSIPFPPLDKEEYLQLTDSEIKIREDVLNYYINLGKAISRRSAGHSLHKKTTKKQLEDYGQTYCQALNDIYIQAGKCWQVGEVLQTNHYTVYQIGFGKNNKLKYKFGTEPGQDIKVLLEDALSNSGISYKRIIRIYMHVSGCDCVFMIKPNAQRYWLNSIALRDADDTFYDLKNAGF